MIPARLRFWVSELFLIGFVLERGASAGEGFAESLAAGVAPVGVELAGFFEHSLVSLCGHRWTPGNRARCRVN